MTSVVRPRIVPLTATITETTVESSPTNGELLRDKLVSEGIITPLSAFRKMDRDDPRRVEYELKWILRGD